MNVINHALKFFGTCECKYIMKSYKMKLALFVFYSELTKAVKIYVFRHVLKVYRIFVQI